ADNLWFSGASVPLSRARLCSHDQAYSLKRRKLRTGKASLSAQRSGKAAQNSQAGVRLLFLTNHSLVLHSIRNLMMEKGCMAENIEITHNQKEVSLFITCLVDQFFPNVGEAVVQTLRGAGCEITFDDRQTCCGQPAFNTGYREEARALAKRFIEIFEPA